MRIWLPHDRNSVVALLSLCLLVGGGSFILSSLSSEPSEPVVLPAEGRKLKESILKAFDGVPGHEDFGPFGSNGLMISMSDELKEVAVGSSKDIRGSLLGIEGDDATTSRMLNMYGSKFNHNKDWGEGDRGLRALKEDWDVLPGGWRSLLEDTRGLDEDIPKSMEMTHIPWMDGSAQVLRRDATKVRAFDAAFTHALEQGRGVFGYFWDPAKNMDLVKCATPVDSWSACRVSEDGKRDRCGHVIKNNDLCVFCPAPRMVHNLEVFDCDEKDGGPSCIQQMLEAKKANAKMYTDFIHDCGLGEDPMDLSHTEVVLVRDQYVTETQDVPRATGWVWAHTGPRLKTHKELQENKELQKLLCGLYTWNAELWEPTGKALEQPKYLLQMITMDGYAGVKKADEFFDLIDLEQLCLAYI